jgi:hypothetical protein
VAALPAILIGLVFGGGDQYLGSRIALGAWASSVSLMSAPWLVLPFLAGTTARRPGRAAAIGTAATAAALAGYFAMTLSPIEGVSSAAAGRALPGLLGSNVAVIAGGAVTAPLYGVLGWRWRCGRRLVPALMVAAALCLEPVARWWAGRASRPALVWQLEVVAGVAAALALVAVRPRPVAGPA